MLAHQMVCYSHQSDRSIMGMSLAPIRSRHWGMLIPIRASGYCPLCHGIMVSKKCPKVDQELITNGLLRTLGTTSIKQSMKYTSMK